MSSLPPSFPSERTAKGVVTAWPLASTMLRHPEAMLHNAFSFSKRVLDQHIAEGGDLGRGFSQRGDAEYVAQHNADVFAALEAA